MIYRYLSLTVHKYCTNIYMFQFLMKAACRLLLVLEILEAWLYFRPLHAMQEIVKAQCIHNKWMLFTKDKRGKYA